MRPDAGQEEGDAPPPAATDPLTVHELAEEYGVTVNAITRAILRGAQRGRPAPDPVHVDRAVGTRYFDPEKFGEWWDRRPRPGRPRTAAGAPADEEPADEEPADEEPAGPP